MYEEVKNQFSQCETSGMCHSKLSVGQTFFECLSQYLLFTALFYVIGPTSQQVIASSTVIMTNTLVD
jgi:hypothetical protein